MNKPDFNMESQIQNNSSIKPWIRALLILPAYLFIVGFFQLISCVSLGIDPINNHLLETPVQKMVAQFFSLIGTCLTVGIFLKYIDKHPIQSAGFYPQGVKWESISGLVLGMLILSCGFLILILLHEIQWQGMSFSIGKVLINICLFIFVALSEEILIRGYILNNLMQSMNKTIALVISAVLFSSMHGFNKDFSWLGFWNILLAGVLLGLPYIYTQRLWFSIALHFSWNFFQGPVFGFNVSGHETQALITQIRTSDSIWNGGLFGFEGSVLSIILQLIAIGVLWWFYRKKENTSGRKKPIE